MEGTMSDENSKLCPECRRYERDEYGRPQKHSEDIIEQEFICGNCKTKFLKRYVSDGTMRRID